MSKLFSHLVCIIIGVITASLLFNSKEREKEIVERVKTVRDTIVMTKTDTIKLHNLVYKEKKIIDTIVIKENTNIMIEQKKYGVDEVFDVWVSGYETRMDSARVYEREKEIIIRERIKERERKRLIFLAGGGLIASESKIIPHLDISMVLNEKNAYTLNVGIDNGGEKYIGVSYSRILNNK